MGWLASFFGYEPVIQAVCPRCNSAVRWGNCQNCDASKAEDWEWTGCNGTILKCKRCHREEVFRICPYCQQCRLYAELFGPVLKSYKERMRDFAEERYGPKQVEEDKLGTDTESLLREFHNLLERKKLEEQEAIKEALRQLEGCMDKIQNTVDKWDKEDGITRKEDGITRKDDRFKTF